jgi:FHA domain-containing protein
MPTAQAPAATLSDNGGTIGRQDRNALVLPDPDRVISRIHARLEFRAGAYYVMRACSPHAR